MKFPRNLNIKARLSIALGLSAFAHLVIIFLAQPHTTADNGPHKILSVFLLQKPAVQNTPESTPAIVQAAPPPENKKIKEIKEIENFSADKYFSAAQLSQPPVLLDAAAHPLPAWPRQLPNEVVFRLWIDKQGQVQRVQAMTEDLPPAFVKAMRRYYLGAAFTAGSRPDGAVNAMIDITLAVTLSE